MLRGPDEGRDGALCLAFANTRSDVGDAASHDELDTYESLVAWARGQAIVDDAGARALAARARRDARGAAAALSQAKELRSAVYTCMHAVASGALPSRATLKALDRFVEPALHGAALGVAGARITWIWPCGDGLAAPLLAPVARSAAQRLTSPDALPIVECASETCSWLVVDTTKNHSRKFCTSQGCGNRTRVRMFYERRRAAKR